MPSPRYQFEDLLAAQWHKERIINESNYIIECLNTVMPAGRLLLNTPPTSVIPGEFFVVGPSPTGIWVGKENALCVYTANGYLYRSAVEGMQIQTTDGSTWVFTSGVWTQTFEGGKFREVMTADRTYFVRNDGNDANTGLVDSTTGAFKTIQKAINHVCDNVDQGLFRASISVRTPITLASNAELIKMRDGFNTGNGVFSWSSLVSFSFVITAAAGVTGGSVITCSGMTALWSLNVSLAASGANMSLLTVENNSRILVSGGTFNTSTAPSIVIRNGGFLGTQSYNGQSGAEALIAAGSNPSTTEGVFMRVYDHGQFACDASTTITASSVASFGRCFYEVYNGGRIMGRTPIVQGHTGGLGHVNNSLAGAINAQVYARTGGGVYVGSPAGVPGTAANNIIDTATYGLFTTTS